MTRILTKILTASCTRTRTARKMWEDFGGNDPVYICVPGDDAAPANMETMR